MVTETPNQFDERLPAHTFPAYWPNWGDGDLVQVTWPDRGGISQWIGRIDGERMGPEGPKPHHIAEAVVTVIERAAKATTLTMPSLDCCPPGVTPV